MLSMEIRRSQQSDIGQIQPAAIENKLYYYCLFIIIVYYIMNFVKTVKNIRLTRRRMVHILFFIESLSNFITF